MTEERETTASPDEAQAPEGAAHEVQDDLTPPPVADGMVSAPGVDEAPAEQGAAPPPAPASAPASAYQPSYVFLAVATIVSLGLDLGTKWWARERLSLFTTGFLGKVRCTHKDPIPVIRDHLDLIFACNEGGAFGLLQKEPESIRRPFFLAISVVAVAFIVSLYRKLTPRQWALRWGLPLVLAGALGNLVNRIQYNYVVDFIDYSAGWVRSLFVFLGMNPTDHWPTFNVADITIVVGVLLMAVDMFTPAKKPGTAPSVAPATSQASSPSASAPAGGVGTEGGVAGEVSPRASSSEPSGGEPAAKET